MKTIMLLALFAVLLIPLATMAYTAATSTYPTSTSPNQESQTQNTSTANHDHSAHQENSSPEVRYFYLHDSSQ